jgi:hypothetical protein
VLRWLLQVLLATLVVRFLIRALGGRFSTPNREFSPPDPSERAKSRGARPSGPGDLSPYEIADADYEEIPGRPR